MEDAPDLMPRELTPAKSEEEEEGNTRNGRKMSEGFSEEAWAMMMENASSFPSTPFVERMAVLDTILCAIEDKQSTSGSSIHSHRSARRSSPPTTPSSLEKHCKTAEEVLEETETKGSLLERVASLDKKVALLSMSLQRLLYHLYASSNNEQPLHPSAKDKQESLIAQPHLENEGSQLLLPQQECTPREKATTPEKLQKKDQHRWGISEDNFLLCIGYGLFFGFYQIKVARSC